MGTLQKLDIFSRKCVLNGIEIRLCARIENGVKQLLALVTEDGNIVLYYNFGGLPPVLKHIPWFTDNDKIIQGICFDPTATWLLVITTDVTLYILPALYMVDPKQKIDCKWSLTDTTVFNRDERTNQASATCVAWWQTLDSNQNAIVGHCDGTLTAVSLTDGRWLASWHVEESIARIDAWCGNTGACVLISSPSGRQWRLALESQPNGSPENCSQRSRLSNLKQLSAEKLAGLRQRLSDSRGRHDVQSCIHDNGNGHPVPSQLPDTRLSVQYARGRNALLCGYHAPSRLITLLAEHDWTRPLAVHRLPPTEGGIPKLLVTDRFLYVIYLRSVQIVSSRLSETRLDIDQPANQEAIVVEFPFTERGEQVLAVYRLAADGGGEEPQVRQSQEHTLLPLARTEQEINIRRPKVDTCVIVTNQAVYKIVIGCSVIEKFVSLVTEKLELDMAEHLSVIFGLNVQQLLEYSADIQLSREKFPQAISLYRLSRCRPLKTALKLAVSGHCHQLLAYITACLANSGNGELSAASRKHLSNLAVMAHAETCLRAASQPLQRATNITKFSNFLCESEHYDEILAVNVLCQTALWRVLINVTEARSLAPDVLDVIVKSTSNFTSDPVLDELLSHSMLLEAILAHPQQGKEFLNFLKENMGTFSPQMLIRLSNSLDASRSVIWSVLTCVMQKYNTGNKESSSLDSTLDSTDWEPPDQLTDLVREFLDIYIQILITLGFKKDFSPFESQYLENVTVEPLKISENQSISLQTLGGTILSAGFYHACLIRNGNLLTWGYDTSGCLGLGPLVQRNSTPKQIEYLSTLQVEIVGISCGRSHTLALSNRGFVYSWGSNNFGQLGIGKKVLISPYPQLVEALVTENICQISAGQYHSVALTPNGKVFIWGWGVHGQLGLGNTQTHFIPQLVKLDDAVVQISAGHAHTLALMRNGKVFAWGNNSFGQLGDGTPVKKSLPTRVLIDVNIVQIATGYFHGLGLSSDGQLFSWGASPQSLRHAVHAHRINRQKQQSEDEPVEWKIGSTPFSLDSKHLTPVELTSLPTGPIARISCGGSHSALIMRDGRLFTWGYNIDGQMGIGGRGATNETSVPQLVKFNEQPLRCSHVSCGADYTLAMDHVGNVYAWGSNAKGQLGRVSEEDDRGLDGKMVMLKSTKRILKIPKSCQSITETPKEIKNIPAIHITYKQTDKFSFINKHLPYLYPLPKIENNFLKTEENENLYIYGQKTLHYVLQTYFGFYDTESVLHKCVELKNYQAASKISYLDGHFSDSLGFQLNAFKIHMDSSNLVRVDKKVENVRKVEPNVRILVEKKDDGQKKVEPKNVVSVISTSCSLESIKQFNDESLESQGGFESLCEENLTFERELTEIDLSEEKDTFNSDVIRKTVSYYVNNIDPQLITSELNLESLVITDKFENRPIENEFVIQNVDIIESASKIIEFYCSQPHITENPILIQNILIKSMQFWILNDLPVDILEDILLRNMEKYFYPLSILLFCKNFNNNLGEGMVKDSESKKTLRSVDFLKRLSTKFCLQLCSMVLKNVNKA